ncbi:MAG: hypothetical protein JWN15_109, partial [Firmicutes bacterium]|nr:hypothetical protein [Bacillota bacterium]
LDVAAQLCLESPLDRTPPLISDASLQNAKETLAKWTAASLQSGYSVPREVITMPKSKLGQRPVLVSSLPARVTYQALVSSIASDLEPNSREGEAYARHQSFAEESTTEYVVEIDIAGCYEFIDHERLRQEIVARSLNAEIAQALYDYLGECSPNQRGLPQLTSASDTLADLYLSIIQRKLMRRRLEVSRYADDFRVRAQDWEAAIDVIEYASEFAREVGLIISDDKTKPIRTTEFRAKITSRREFEEKYFDEAKDRLTLFHIMESAYEEPDWVSVSPSDTAALVESMRRIIQHWQASSDETKRTPEVEHAQELYLRRMIPLAIKVLRSDPYRISNKVFLDLVAKEPIRLEPVCEYVLARVDMEAEMEENWNLMNRLASSGRLSPWGKVWILHTAGRLHPVTTRDFRSVLSWVKSQLTDRHETIRAEAAWTLASHSRLQEEPTLDLLREASPITQTGVAAAMGKQGGFNPSLIKSVTGENALIRAAYQWGCEA